MAATLFLRGRVVTLDGVLDDGVVAVDGTSISWVGRAADALLPDALPVLGADTLLPGLVDIHCHGGGGASFPDAVALGEVRVAAREHLRCGTTSLVASLVTAAGDALVAQAALLAEAVEAGDLAGVHAEGPFLSRQRRGAQSPDHLVSGDPALVRQLADAARGALVTMTVAPEVPGVVTGRHDVVAALAAAGAIPSIGHTDADAERAETAITRVVSALAAVPALAGRRPTATHLFNGMRPLHHRDPSAVAACLVAAARGELVVELVSDGTHLADATVKMVFDLVGPDAIALVTDAMAATGLGDGHHRLGPMGRARRGRRGADRRAGWFVGFDRRWHRPPARRGALHGARRSGAGRCGAGG